MNKSAADVEREVEASRGRLNRTAEALKQKMAPGELFEEASHRLGSASQAVLTKVVEQARENPLPMALIGLGAAWLLVSAGRSKPARASQHRYHHADYDGGYRNTAYGDTGYGDTDLGTSGMQETAAGLAESAKERMAQVRDSGRNMMGRSGEMLREAPRRAREYRERVQETFTETVDQEPLLLAGMGALLGLAIGCALPATRTENRLMGRMRDNLMQEGQRMAEQGVQQVQKTAEDAYNAAKEELERGDGDLSTNVEQAARAGASAVRDGLPN